MSEVATRQIENLERSWEHLWQRPCANTTSISVAKIQPLRPDAAELTSQIVLTEVDLCHRIAELANVRRKREPGVARELDGAVLDKFPAQKSNRNFA